MIPKNIRQIGEGETSKKVYIEDYVITFLKQVQKKLPGASQSVSLYGHIFYEDGFTYAIIKGAAFTTHEGDAYFSEYERVGHAAIIEVNRRIGEVETTANLLSKNSEEDTVYFEIRDSKWNEDFEKNNDFFTCGNMFFVEKGRLESLKSYYIFYEKNDTMQDYLIDWNNKREKDQSEKIKDKAVHSFRKNYYEKQDSIFHKKMMVCFYALSTCMLLITCIMGITMINSFDKMKNMELAMSHLVVAMNEQKLTQVPEEIVVEVQKESQEVIAQEPDDEESVSDKINPHESASEESVAEEPVAEEPVVEVPVVEESVVEKSVDEPATERLEQVQNIYIIEDGDTLAKISEKFYNTNQRVAEICDLNNIENPNKIVVGEKILLP